MVNDKRLSFKEAAPIAVIVIGAAIAFSQIKSSEWTGQSIASIRTAYAEIRNREDGARLLEDRLNRTQNEGVAAEYLLLLASMGITNPPEDFLEGLLKRHYPTGSTQRSRMILDALRSRYSFQDGPLPHAATGSKRLALANKYPFDFAAQALFARDPWDIGRARSEIARQVIERAEKLTDHHPRIVWYRARFEQMLQESGEPLEPSQRAIKLFRLHNYALHLAGIESKDPTEADYLYQYILARNQVPAEPSAKEYLAIKRRGWTFNKQMLEPFRKVD